MKNVSIIEHDRGQCESLRDLIDASGRYRCLSSYGNAVSAKSGILNGSPHIVIFEIGLPNSSGIECVRWLKPRMAKTDFLAFTAKQDAKTIFEAFSAGATGYLCKGAKPREVIRALDALSAGGSPLDPAVARKLVDAFSGQRQPSVPLPPTLTRREREILEEIVQGHMLKNITGKLGISQGTLNTHMCNLYRKLKVNSRGEIMTRYFFPYVGLTSKRHNDGPPGTPPNINILRTGRCAPSKSVPF